MCVSTCAVLIHSAFFNFFFNSAVKIAIETTDPRIEIYVRDAVNFVVTKITIVRKYGIKF